MCHAQVSRSDTMRYFLIGLSRLTPRLGPVLIRLSRSGSSIWYDLVRTDTFRYVLIRSSRADTLCYGLLRFVAMISFTMEIESDHDMTDYETLTGIQTANPTRQYS